MDYASGESARRVLQSKKKGKIKSLFSLGALTGPFL